MSKNGTYIWSLSEHVSKIDLRMHCNLIKMLSSIRDYPYIGTAEAFSCIRSRGGAKSLLPLAILFSIHWYQILIFL